MMMMMMMISPPSPRLRPALSRRWLICTQVKVVSDNKTALFALVSRVNCDDDNCV